MQTGKMELIDKKSTSDHLSFQTDKRRHLNLEQKLMIVAHAEKFPGLSLAKMCLYFKKDFGRTLSKNSIKYILANKEKILGMAGSSRKGIFRIKNGDVRQFEKTLAKEISETYRPNTVSETRIKQIAIELQSYYFKEVVSAGVNWRSRSERANFSFLDLIVAC